MKCGCLRTERFDWGNLPLQPATCPAHLALRQMSQEFAERISEGADPRGGGSHADAGGHAYMDLSSQKILANRAGWELCSVFRVRIQFPSNVPLGCLSRTRNSLAKLTPLCACHAIRSCFHQDREHKPKSRRPAASFLRETRAQSKHRAPALPFPVG